ncbi:MAG: molybdenum cofactor guanylyltransferase, partial [Gammaproteobacteria bacterium]|nr:molybdenum cofactor guanylyltransferase [Gammaproteobacteria bacterium]
MSSIIGVVLAGGNSKRMGLDKAELPHPLNEQQTLLDHAMEILINCGCRKVVISGSKWDGIPDQFDDQGPMAGIYSVLDAIAESSFLFVPVDMPLLDPFLLQELVSASEVGTSVYFEDTRLPLLLRVNDSVKAYLSRVLSFDNEDQSLFSFYHAINALPIACSQPEKL